jgi:hypothetical protein
VLSFISTSTRLSRCIIPYRARMLSRGCRSAQAMGEPMHLSGQSLRSLTMSGKSLPSLTSLHVCSSASTAACVGHVEGGICKTARRSNLKYRRL